MRTTILTILIFLGFQTLCQEKYAILINRYTPYDTDSELSYSFNLSGEYAYEFWNDIYLMWEMLFEKGFEDDNIFVCF